MPTFVVGTALGGLIATLPDVDLGLRKSSLVRLVAVNLLLIATEPTMVTLAQIAVLDAVVILGSLSDHRSFTHSLLALVLVSLGLFGSTLVAGLSYGTGLIGIAGALAWASHGVLDLLNKKSVQAF